MLLHILASVLLALALLLPPAIKWELRLNWVGLWSIFIGLFVGAIAATYFPSQAFSLVGVAIQGAAILVASGAVLAWRFFRDPERSPPDDRRAILSPADGVVIYINEFDRGVSPGGIKGKGRYSLKELTKSDVFSGGGCVIGIGMSFLDVHVNRAPVAGTIEQLSHIPGEFISLKRPEALARNERAFMLIRTAEGHLVGMVQIASRLVRRIVTYVKLHDTVAAGQRIGMIKFGSQVDLILPAEMRASVRCRVGQQVHAGLTPLAICDNQS